MPNLLVKQESSNVSLDTTQYVGVTSALLRQVLEALGVLHEQIANVDEVRIEQTDPDGIFTYVLKTASPERVYRQMWFFDTDSTRVAFGNVTGTWVIDELLSNINIRNAIRSLHTSVGLLKLTCKW